MVYLGVLKAQNDEKIMVLVLFPKGPLEKMTKKSTPTDIYVVPIRDFVTLYISDWLVDKVYDGKYDEDLLLWIEDDEVS